VWSTLVSTRLSFCDLRLLSEFASELTTNQSVAMAWKTPAGQKKPSQPAKKKEDGSFPGLKVAGESEIKTPYEELQLDEVTALQAIYGDDFIEHKAASAWKV